MRIFSSELTLILPDPYKAFFLETDASNVATGGVLYQLTKQDNTNLVDSYQML